MKNPFRCHAYVVLNQENNVINLGDKLIISVNSGILWKDINTEVESWLKKEIDKKLASQVASM